MVMPTTVIGRFSKKGPTSLILLMRPKSNKIICFCFLTFFNALFIYYKTYKSFLTSNTSLRYNILLTSSYNKSLILKHIYLLENITYLDTLLNYNSSPLTYNTTLITYNTSLTGLHCILHYLSTTRYVTYLLQTSLRNYKINRLT